MNNKRSLSIFTQLLAIIGLACMISVAMASPDTRDKGTLLGQVTDAAGAPIEGVKVSVLKGPSVTTNESGLYTLAGVKQKKRVVVQFEKDGYATTQLIARLKTKPNKFRDEDQDDDEDEDKDSNKSAHKGKSSHVTLATKVMVPIATRQNISAQAGGSISHNGYKVTFPAGALDTVGDVEVSLSPVNIYTDEVRAFPGEFSGISSSGQRVRLKAFGLMDVEVKQNGRTVRLRPGSTARLEIPLHQNTQLTPGQTLPLWWFDATRGVWREDGFGQVGDSTDLPSRLAVVGEVSHFTSWIYGYVSLADAANCVRGRVLRGPLTPPATGGTVTYAAVANANVHYQAIWGLDYGMGISVGDSTTTTDAGGNYCILVSTNQDETGVPTGITTYRIYASWFDATGVHYISRTIHRSVLPPAALIGCASCVELPDLILSSYSCVVGEVEDHTGSPVAGISVYLEPNLFNFYNMTYTEKTRGDGSYCMVGPSSERVTISVGSGHSVSTTAPLAHPGGYSCSRAACGSAPTIRLPAPPPPPPLPACVSGDVLDAAGAPVVGATVYANPGESSTTNAAGVYQLLAPANSLVAVSTAGYPSVSVTTGAAGGACVSAPLRLSTGTNNACVSGFLYQCTTDNRYPGVSIMASDMAGTTLGVSLPSNANGEYCIDALPANTDLQLQLAPNGAGGVQANSGVGGGSCAANSCNVVPPMDIFCH